MKYQKGSFAIVPNINFMQEVSHQAFKIFVCLCRFADDDGVAFPRRSLLAGITDLSPNRISKFIKELEDKEWLKREKRYRSDGSQAANCYQIMVKMREGGLSTVNKGGYRQSIRGVIDSQEPINVPSNVPDKNNILGKFKKPNLGEVQQYIAEQGYSIDPEHFWDTNEARGWMVGKSPMRDWKAAVRTWVRNSKKWEKQKPRHKWQDFFDLLDAYVPSKTIDQLEQVDGTWKKKPQAYFGSIDILDLWLNFGQAIKDNDDWPITSERINHMNNPKLIEFLKTHKWKSKL